jgi:monofunctional biosynthetic peptidoglycan transglycosylase
MAIVIKKILKLILLAIPGFFVFSVLLVSLFKFVDPPITPLMVIRVAEGIPEGKLVSVEKNWRSYDQISKNAPRAVISAEDARFMKHEGIDWKAVDAAKRYNAIKKGRKLRGASTITMQTAKNTFLWHDRNYIRKGLEIYFTYLIEAIWGKKRIIEVYLNVIEFGEGIYGVEAASQKFFGKPSSDLSRREAALLAAVLPNPRRWSPAKPTKYIEKRVNFVQGRMNSVPIPKD